MKIRIRNKGIFEAIREVKSTPYTPASGGQWKDASGGQFFVAFGEEVCGGGRKPLLIFAKTCPRMF